MSDHTHHAEHPQVPHSSSSSLNRLALAATLHCLTGCSIGEVAGLAIGTALGLGQGIAIALAFVLAFLFGYAFTLWPLLRSGLLWRQALSVALAADTVSITVMEIVDNGVMLLIPGAMSSGVTTPLFWLSMAAALVAGGVAAFPVNRWLIARGRGHAVAHAYH